jgi:hypothetical protein
MYQNERSGQFAKRNLQDHPILRLLVRLDKAARDAKVLAEKVASDTLKEAMSKLGSKLKESLDKTISESPT